MPSPEIFCLVLLLTTVGLLLYADFNRRLDSSRIAAMLALLTIAGADYFFVQAMPFGRGIDVTHPASAKRQPTQGRGSAAQGGTPTFPKQDGSAGSRGGMSQGDAATDDKEGVPTEVSDAMDASTGTDIHAAIEGAGRSLREWLKTWLAQQSAETRSLVQVRDFKDCEACPDMVRIPSGVRLIGDPDGENSTPSGRMPQREMRVWPGFAVARDEITMAQLQAAGITPRGGSACGSFAEVDPHAPVACVTASEMEAYIGWLNLRTGRRYRLLSAAEWEFAARASMDDDAGLQRMGGGLAEMVSDCWPAGTAATPVAPVTSRCSHRVVKDGADGEERDWHHPAARRAFEADARSAQVGFRVMRPFDLTAKKGF